MSATLPTKVGSVTKDQWVLQTVADYQLELKNAPCQTHIPHQIQTTTENATLITTKVAELLTKEAVAETQLSPDSYVSQIFYLFHNNPPL